MNKRIKKLDSSRIFSDTELARIYEMCQRVDLTKQEITDTLNMEFGRECISDTYYKKYNNFIKMYDAISKDFLQSESDKKCSEKIDELYKAQCTMRDAVNEKRRLLRDESRLTDFSRGLLETIEKCKTIDYKLNCNIITGGTSEAIIAISDWHIGCFTDNFYNKYNTNIVRQRVSQLLDNIVWYCRLHKVKKITVINLSDMIEGNIHITGRISATMNTTQQAVEASIIIAEFLKHVCNNVEEVVYKSVLDNHSRLNKLKEEHIEAESLVTLIDEMIVLRCTTLENLEFVFDNIDQNVGLVTLNSGGSYAFTHGHLDKGTENNTILNYMTMYEKFGITIDGVIMGHKHNYQIKSVNGKKVFVVGTLMGSNDYAINNRYFGTPSQTLFIHDNHNFIPIPISLS